MCIHSINTVTNINIWCCYLCCYPTVDEEGAAVPLGEASWQQAAVQVCWLSRSVAV